jgi:hypothetical protein
MGQGGQAGCQYGKQAEPTTDGGADSIHGFIADAQRRAAHSGDKPFAGKYLRATLPPRIVVGSGGKVVESVWQSAVTRME